MSSAFIYYKVCCIYPSALQTTFIMEANTMNPDQTALQIFFNITFFQNILSGKTSVPNSLDGDQARPSVGPDLGPKCLQRSSADYKIPH